MYKKEVECSVLLGVLKVKNYSEWGYPSFTQPKPKSNQVCFLSDFRNISKQLKKKQYPMQKNQRNVIEIRWFSVFYVTLFRHKILSYPN